MRQNLPVTSQEFPFPAGKTLMSTTDTAGRIQFANAAFVEVSGYARDELLGQPHNLVRHPDMPPAAFADLWATLKAGRSWTALVKNRRKSGDHYWVRANATPMRRGGTVVGYMSVRTAPSRDEVREAEALHARLARGDGGSLRLHQGVLVHGGWSAWRSALRTLSLRGRVALGLGLGALPPVLAALALPAGGAAAAWAVPVAAALGAALGWAFLFRQVTRPVELLARQAQLVASGQVDDAAPLPRTDVVGALSRSINQSGLNLRALLDDVGHEVQALGSAAAQIASGNADLSERTERAAASLQQTASSMEQMTGTVQNTAANAANARELAGATSQTAEQGGGVVAEMVQTMNSIHDSSRRIADIIATIDGIAFQTNILALNAAVEAARAGEQGRGFAVVAGEVRGLARRSADAAQEIKKLIDDSVRRVEAGNQQASEAGQAVQRIVEQVRRMNALVAEISTAALEQSKGLGLVNDSVSRLDEATQQNAALVEQSAAAAGSLREQARALRSAVEAFSVAA